jgi:hypothetical protein
MTTIPASTIVNVTPNVLAAGGEAVDLTGLFLSTAARVPIGQVASFPSATAVQNYFGPSSIEASYAGVYFQADDNSLAKPGNILFAQFPFNAVSAFLRGASVASLGLTGVQLLTGTLTVTVNGTVKTGNVNLGSATTLPGAAAIIANTLGLTGVQHAVATGQQGATYNASGTLTTLTVGTITSGFLSVGDIVLGTGVPANTIIVSQSSGSAGGTGTYVLNQNTTAIGTLTSQSAVLNVTAVSSGSVTLTDVVTGTGVATSTFVSAQLSGGTVGGVGRYTTSVVQFYPSQAITTAVPGCQYDSVSGGFIINSPSTGTGSTITFASGALGTSLFLTQAAGAVISQGAAATASNPAAFMNQLLTVTTNWGTFQCCFNPDDSTGLNTNKLAFAAWVSTQDDEFAYICQDNDLAPTVTVPATLSLGQVIATNNYSGVVLVWEPSELFHTALVAGWAASLNFDSLNGRRTLAFRSQAGLTPGVTDQTTAANLLANNYNFYGIYATARQNFIFMYDGGISGPFQWADSYMNQIWLNSAFQADLMTLLTQVGSIPYNSQGASLIESALSDTINTAVNFGVLRGGVNLSALQISEVNSSAGKNISTTLQTRGWYLLVQQASPAVRQARGSPPCTFWYVDGESVQSIDLDSVELQ